MADIDVDHKLRETQREYLEFLDDEEDKGIYNSKVKAMIEDGKVRIVVNVNDLRAKNPVRAKALLHNGFEEQIAFQRALHEYVNSVDSSYGTKHDEFFISCEGSFGNKHVSPRTLTSRFLGNMVCVEGIVTKCSMINPKIVKSVHYCPATGRTIERRYTDLTSLDAFPSASVYPTKDDDGNPLETEYGKSLYKDHQTMTIQEMPEKSPPGQLPRNVDVILDNDLVDLCKPGDRVQVVGTHRCLPAKKGGFTSGTFRTIVIANHVTQLNNAEADVQMTKDDVNNCRTFGKRRNVFEILTRSLAPSIQGHEHEKMAILCMLLGGVEKILPNGTRLRGDINVLLIGDPSVAKSQLLRYVLYTAPRAINTTGRGSSGVGLTAAVTTDPETNERRLEAGAMVLADRGVVCIDEFDKMSDADRTAIHEVMEQGRVTISKAGIHAKLNARCSVLAAANPVYGRYDQYKTPMENIGLQDSLLSRFDLIFVMLDTANQETDEKIADHVIRMHRYRKPGEQDGEVLSMGTLDLLSTRNLEEFSIQERTSTQFEKYDLLLHGHLRNKREKILTVPFMKKYIELAKHFNPILNDDAARMIAEEYAKLRSDDAKESNVARTQPVTARTLETLIRLSTAHAKARLSRTINATDAENAIALVEYAIFKKVKPKERKRKADETGTETEDSEEEVDDPESQPKRTRKRNRMDPYEFSDDTVEGTNLDSQNLHLVMQESTGTDMPPSEPSTDSTRQLPPPTEISKERLQYFRKCVKKMFDDVSGTEPLKVENIIQYVNDNRAVGEAVFDGGEISAAISKMQADNEVMLADGRLFLV